MTRAKRGERTQPNPTHPHNRKKNPKYRISKIFFDVFGLIRSKNGMEYLGKYPKTASNQKVPEAKVSLNAKKTLSPESQVAN